MITKLLTTFDVYESKLEAVNSVKSRALDFEEHRLIFVKEAHHEAIAGRS